MKALIIGDGNSRFVRDFINNLDSVDAFSDSIDLFSMTYPVKNPEAIRSAVLFQPGMPAFFSRVKLVLVLTRIFSLFILLVRERKKYDLLHIHYASPDLVLLSSLFGRIKARLVITVFGSDFYRVRPGRRKMLKKLFLKASAVTFANEQTRLDFCSFYNFPQERTTICRFGLAPLDLIKEPGTIDLSVIRKNLGLPIDKIIICVGYNCNRNQQHYEVIKNIVQSKIFTLYRDKIHFVFPLTYGSENEYRERLQRDLQVFPYNNTVFPDYLSEEENADLRMACDIMIQVQLSDQFSGAMQEHLCAGNCVITGSWLPYSAFEEAGVFFRKIDSIDDLMPTLVNCLQGIEEEKKNASVNYQVIRRMSSWTHTLKSWVDLYKHLAECDS